MTHALKAAAAAALTLGLVLTATAGAQAEIRSAQTTTTSTTTARIATVGGDITAQARPFRGGVQPSHGSHLNDKPTHGRLDPICRHCAA